MKSPWLIVALAAAILGVAWLLPRADPGTKESPPETGDDGSRKSALAATNAADTTRRERHAERKTKDAEARKEGLKESFKKRFHSDLSEDQRMQDCREILTQLGKVADFHEVLAFFDEIVGNDKTRSLLLPAVFMESRQSVPELVAAAKEMSAEDRNSGIVGIADKVQHLKLPASAYGVVQELATGMQAQAFSVMLDLDLIRQGDGVSKQKRYGELSSVASTLPAERRAGYEVALAGVGRHEMPELAWETLSGESAAGKEPDQLRAETLSLMMEKDPVTAMATLFRGRPTAGDELERSMVQWLSRDPVAARAWYDEFSPGLIGEQAERLAWAMDTAGP